VGEFVISARQFTIITILFSIGSAILIIPKILAMEAKQGAWIAAILGVVVSILLVKLFIAVASLTRDMSLVEINEKILGKWVGKAVSITFVFFTFISAGVLLQFVENFMRTEIMPETPAIAFNVFFSLLIIFGCYLGLETIARTAELLFPFFVLLFVAFAVLIFPQIDVQNIQPVLEVGTKPLIFSTLLFMGYFSFPMVVLLMLFPVSINEYKGAKNAFYIGTIIGGIVLIVIIGLAILVLGADFTAHQRFPSFTLAKRISLGNFLERLEVIMAFLWIITIFYRVLIYFYATVIGIAQIFNLKDYRSLLLPLGMILVVVSLIVSPNVVYTDVYNKDIWVLYASTYGLFLPLVLLVVSKIRKLRK